MLAFLCLGVPLGFLSGLLGGRRGGDHAHAQRIFDRLGFSVDTTQHLSPGTSLATNLFTSLSSVLAHRRYGSRAHRHLEKMAPASLRARSAARLLSPPFRDYSCAAFRLLRHAGRRSSALPPHPRPKIGRLEQAMLPVSILIGLISSLAGIARDLLCVIFTLVWAPRSCGAAPWARPPP